MFLHHVCDFVTVDLGHLSGRRFHHNPAKLLRARVAYKNPARVSQLAFCLLHSLLHLRHGLNVRFIFNLDIDEKLRVEGHSCCKLGEGLFFFQKRSYELQAGDNAIAGGMVFKKYNMA